MAQWGGQQAKRPAAQQAVAELTVSATLTDELSLAFTVTWTGKAPLRMYSANLPWGTVHSTLVVAAYSNGDHLLRSLPIDDPGPGTTSLRPGVPVHGRYDLLQIYPDLKKLSTRRDVIVSWSYEPRALDPDRKLPRTSGSVKIAGAKR
jgi:hypothetical protein